MQFYCDLISRRFFSCKFPSHQYRIYYIRNCLQLFTKSCKSPLFHLSKRLLQPLHVFFPFFIGSNGRLYAHTRLKRFILFLTIVSFVPDPCGLSRPKGRFIFCGSIHLAVSCVTRRVPIGVISQDTILR